MSSIMATPDSTERVGSIHLYQSGEGTFPDWDFRVMTPEEEPISNVVGMALHLKTEVGTISAELEFMPPFGDYTTQGPKSKEYTFVVPKEEEGDSFKKKYDNVTLVSHGVPPKA